VNLAAFLSSRRTILVVLFTMSCLFLFPLLTQGQGNPNTEGGVIPFESYYSGGIDQVSMGTGNLYLEIPLLSYPQVGKVGLSFSLRSSNKGWYVQQSTPSCVTSGCFTWVNGANSLGTIVTPVEDHSYQQIWNGGSGCSKEPTPPKYYVVGPDGSTHNEVITSGSIATGCEATSSVTLETTDGMAFRLSNGTVVSGGLTSGTLIDREGINLSTRQDTNGNQITEHETVISGTQFDLYYTDTLGRKIPFPPQNFVDDVNTEDPSTTNYAGCTGSLPTSSAFLWTPPGPGGTSVTYKFCYATLAVQTDFQLAGVTEASYSATVLQSVVLPNDTAWTFGYNSYMDLTEIGFPTGGSITYTYANVTFFGAGPCAPIPCANMSRAVMTRTLNANDGTGGHQWTYSWGTINPGPPGTMTNTMTDPLGNQTVYANQFLDTWRETSRKIYQGSATGSPLETVSTTWSSYATGDGDPIPVPLPTAITTTWANSQTKQIQTDWDNQLSGASYGNVIARREYDYGTNSPGPLLRTTTTQYEAFVNSAYLTSNLLTLSSSVQVTDSTGVQRAYTTNNYDSATTGNLTSVGRWLSTTGGYLTDSYSYFPNGETKTSTDPNTNVTTYGYSSSYPFPTSITNAAGQITKIGYDLNTDLLTSITDPNKQTTTFAYDNMWRLAKASYPDTGSDTITRQETTFPFSSTVSKAISGSTNYVTTNLFDGVGRLSQSELTSDPLGTDYMVTTYDADGRKYQTYNTTRCSPPTANCGESTWGYTSYLYDTLGRVTLVTNPDQSTVQTLYTGRASRATDEGNGTRSVQRISQADGLGRVTSVCEVSSATLTVGTSSAPAACGQDISATGFLTSYQYDALDNLISVSQGSLNPRTFAYDSMSRMTSSSNPESGTITYSYDSNGNLVTKVAPKPNQTTASATVSTTNTYDALNRLTSITYNDGTTPGANFVYDQCPTSGCPSGYPSTANTVGRLVESYVANAATFKSYDPMGRTAQEWQCTPQTCGSSSYFALPYTYDLLGDVLSSSNGENVTLSYSYNSAAQPTTLKSSLVDSNHPGTLFSNGTYTPFSALTSANLGNGIIERFDYNNRLWLRDSGVGSASGTASGSVTVTGSEKQIPGAGTPGTGSVTISGTEAFKSSNPCLPKGNCPTTTYDSGTVSITVDGFVASVSYGEGSTSSSVASALKTALNSGSSPVTSAVNGSVVSLTSIAKGSSADYSLSATSASNEGMHSYTATPSGSTLTGGGSSPPVYDTGSASITVKGVTVSTTYGSGSTTATIASALASALTSESGSLVTATSSGAVVSITTTDIGSLFDYSLSASSQTSDPSQFSSPSFSLTPSGSSLTGGSGPYSLALTYAPNGDLLSANDTVNGNWNYGNSANQNGYDDFNRLVLATSGSNTYSYTYDRYGNRWQQLLNDTCTAGTASCLTFDSNNHESDGLVTYDAAGNITSDNVHYYSYDAGNRLINVDSGGTASYVYDAFGRRVNKTNAGTTYDYLYDLEGHVITVYAAGWNRSELFLGGSHVATYTNNTTYFAHTDFLATERARTTVTGSQYDVCTSLPFGDDLQCSSTDPSPLHFTGEERDAESGLDNFGARYYSSSFGRWTSPDWSDDQDPVPYADFANPQTLNLYGIVQNNPVTFIDPDGHDEDAEYGILADPDPGQSGPNNNNADVKPAYKPGFLDQIFGFLFRGVPNPLDYADWKDGLNIPCTACYQRAQQQQQAAQKQFYNDIQTGKIQPYQSIILVGPAGFGELESLLQELRAGAPELEAESAELKRIIDLMFKTRDRIPGGTAGAIRHELTTGELMSKAGHSIKGAELANKLRDLLAGGTLSEKDFILARALMNDLLAAAKLR
jgi:RHS repeat-associated protein